MAEIQTVRVQIEGLEELRTLVREFRRAAEAVEKAASSVQKASRSTGDQVARALNDAASSGARR